VKKEEVGMLQTEIDLLRLLHSTETTFVERKSFSDTQDWVKTVVAFANSLRPDQEGVLFLGVTDKGEIQDHNTDLDSLQKKFSEKMKIIYPEGVYYDATEVSDGPRKCLAIVVPGGAQKPYFAGPPYLRVASTSVKPSPDQYERLLATRSDKAYKLQEWIGQAVTLKTSKRLNGVAFQIDTYESEAEVIDCNQFYLTVKYNNQKQSFSLGKLSISYNHQRDHLLVEVQTADY